MELTIEQKEKLLEYFLGCEKCDSDSIMTVYPKNLYHVYKNNVYTGPPYQIKSLNEHWSKFPESERPNYYKKWSYRWFNYCPESNIEQAILLLDRLSAVSKIAWHMMFLGNGKYVIKDPNYIDKYSESGDSICELIVNACLWWIENNERA